MKKTTLKEMRVYSQYNTITKLYSEESFEWIISHPNVKPSCVSSDVVTILNSESN